jgi:putative pyoverdin transport system ATP-binding/permease protein
MKLLMLLWRESPFIFALSVISSALGSVITIYLVSVVSQGISGDLGAIIGWSGFFILILGAVAGQVISNISVSFITVKATRKLRIRMTNQIASAALVAVETEGHPRIMATLLEDVSRVSNTMPRTIGLVKDLSFIFSCLGYLGWLSPKMLFLMILVILVGGLLHYPLESHGVRQVKRATKRREQFAALLRNLVDGLKDIKLNPLRSSEVLSEINQCERFIEKYNMKMGVYFSIASGWVLMLFLSILWVVIYSGISDVFDPKLVAAYALSVAFLYGPLQNLTSTSQAIGQAQVALDRFDRLWRTFERAREIPAEHGHLSAQSRFPLPAPAWRKLEIRKLQHAYRSDERQVFTLGPIDLVLHPGELLFVVGGNGSGKTTLAKLLAGLYVPDAGEILLDGIPVDAANRAWYREHFSAVFNEFSLFDGLAGSPHDIAPEQALPLLRKLKLEHIVDPERGLFSQAASFSAGERKRVALLLAYLNDRPIYIFDEVASDQDPICKDLFYGDLLEDLKARGKLVIIITHDARYFDHADYTLNLEREMPPMLTRNPAKEENKIYSHA